MKRTIAILFIFFSIYTFGQSKYSMMLSTGTFFPNSSSFRLGIGGLATFSFQPNNDFVFSFSAGYSTWGYSNTNEYNTRLIPIILGMRYNLSESSIIPYLSGEFQLVPGEIDHYVDIDEETGMWLPKPEKKTRSIFDYGVGFGAGVTFPINNSFGIDIGSSVLLTAKNSNVYNIRTTAGLFYSF